MHTIVSRPPEAVALADWLVGPFSPDEQRAAGELAEWQLPFYQIALAGLRRVTDIREDEPFPPDFQPDPITSVQLYRELAPARKMHGTISSLHSYIADYKTGKRATMLREDQQEIMDALVDDVMRVSASRQVNIKAPTGSGKTAVLTTFIEAAKYREQPNDPVRALVLLPSKDILRQTTKAFKKFTALRPDEYFGERQQIGDVTVMTYQSFGRAIERGDIDRDSFDVVIRDEVDTFSKGKTGALINDYCYNSPTGHNKLVIGLTATPHEEQKLSYERTILESIGDKLLAPLATYQRYTNATVHEDSDRDWREDFKDSEVGHLMDDETRNQLLVKEVVSGLASGRRVMLRCVPGRNLHHPNIMQQILRQLGTVRVQHPFMGDVEYRAIRPVIIPGTMNMRQREILTGIFNNHLDERIDVLLFVGTLIRGFDSPVAKKVINGAPSRSPKLVEQLLGRCERWFETYSGNVMTSQAVDLVDHTESGQVTFADIVNRDAPEGMRYKPGAIIGPGLADLRDKNSAPYSAFIPIPTEEIVAAAQVLTSHGLVELEGTNLRTANPELLRGRAAAQAIAAATLLRTAKPISARQIQQGGRVPLIDAARILSTTPANLLLTAHRIRVGIELGYGANTESPLLFFSTKAFARLRAQVSSSVAR